MVKLKQLLLEAIFTCIVVKCRNIKARSVEADTEPGQPYIVQGIRQKILEIERGNEVELQCESQGGRPPAELQWWDMETEKRIVSDVTEHVTHTEDSNTFNTVSKLKFKHIPGQRIQCSAHNEVFPGGRMSKPLLLGSKKHPKDNIIIQLSENESVNIKCDDELEDHSMRKFKWFINDDEIFNEKSNILELNQVSRSYENSLIKCFLANNLGYFHEVKSVILLYLKKERHPISSSTNTKVNTKKILLTCTGSDEPEEVMIKETLDKIKSGDVITAIEEDSLFRCRFVTNGVTKLHKMEHDTKVIAENLEEFSRRFVEINSHIDGIVTKPSFPL